MGDRKRIDFKAKISGAEKVEDPLQYTTNLCSQNARNIENIPCKIVNNLWYDKHYIYRDTAGEDDGTPRAGIDSDSIKRAITIAFNHLLFYSSTLEKFQFLNHELNGKKPKRILVQNSHSSVITLNVIMETHFIDYNKYETTVITAMCKENFIPFDGQYIVELTGEYSSILKIYANKTFRELHSCQT